MLLFIVWDTYDIPAYRVIVPTLSHYRIDDKSAFEPVRKGEAVRMHSTCSDGMNFTGAGREGRCKWDLAAAIKRPPKNEIAVRCHFFCGIFVPLLKTFANPHDVFHSSWHL